LRAFSAPRSDFSLMGDQPTGRVRNRKVSFKEQDRTVMEKMTERAA